MKKMLSVILAIVCLLALVACGGETLPEEPVESESSESVTESEEIYYPTFKIKLSINGEEPIDVVAVEENGEIYCKIKRLCYHIGYELKDNSITASKLDSVRRNTNYKYQKAVNLTSDPNGDGLLYKTFNNEKFVKISDFVDSFENLYYDEATSTIYKDYITAGGEPDILQIPIMLGWPEYTAEEIEAMQDLTLDEAAAKINTLYDFVNFYRIRGYCNASVDQPVVWKNGYKWALFRTPENVYRTLGVGCMEASCTVTKFLHGDYDEVGYIHWQDLFVVDGKNQPGGHVFSYIKQGDMYYIIEGTCYNIDNELYSPGGDGNHSDSILSDLSEIMDYMEKKEITQSTRDFFVVYTYPSNGENTHPVISGVPDGRIQNGLPAKYRNNVNLLHFEEDFMPNHSDIYYPATDFFVDVEPPTEEEFPKECF